MNETTLVILVTCVEDHDGIWVNDCWDDNHKFYDRYQIAIEEGLIEWSGKYLIPTDKGLMIYHFFQRPLKNLARELNDRRKTADSISLEYALTLVTRHKSDFTNLTIK